ncbi:2Fe-2S iron-sulfur cluster-binding protein, partial [Acinetobacter baumannii]
MTQITFVESNGTRHEVDASNQQSLMQVALSNLIPGILADCGGVCSCATCHVLIDAPWSEQLPAMSETETFLVDGIPDQEPGRSRL